MNRIDFGSALTAKLCKTNPTRSQFVHFMLRLSVLSQCNARIPHLHVKCESYENTIHENALRQWWISFSAALEAAAKPLRPALMVKHVMGTRTSRTQDTTAHARWRLLGSRALKANTHAQIILASRSRHNLAFTSWLTSMVRGIQHFVTSAPKTTLRGLWYSLTRSPTN